MASTKAARPKSDRDASKLVLADEIATLRTRRTTIRANKTGDRKANLNQIAARVTDLEATVLSLTRTVLALAGVDNADDRNVGTDRS